MTPDAFVLFVLRQTYPDNWRKILNSTINIRVRKIIRDGLPDIIEPYWKNMDELTLYLL